MTNEEMKDLCKDAGFLEEYVEAFKKLTNISEDLIRGKPLVCKMLLRGVSDNVIPFSEPALVVTVGSDEHYLPAPIIFYKDNNWIPISEKLPLNCEDVLISTKYGIVTQAKFFPAGWFEKCEDGSVLGIEDVVAWMPMPKPYKENNV